MTATTRERDPQFSGIVPAHGTISALAATKYLKGCMVARDSNGRATVPVTGTANPVIGVAEATFDNTSGANDAMLVELGYGVFGFLISGTVPVAGNTVYAVDNQTVSLTVGTNGLAGVVTEVRSVNGVNIASVYISPITMRPDLT
jgi:hypothetical protein